MSYKNCYSNSILPNRLSQTFQVNLLNLTTFCVNQSFLRRDKMEKKKKKRSTAKKI